MSVFEKRRTPAAPGSIPDVLDMFNSEVRFYQEIAPTVGVRVPRCFEARSGPEGTHLVLEDLAGWQNGGDPIEVVSVLRVLHERWDDRAHRTWPWLRRAGAAADLIGQLFDRVWPNLRQRADLPPPVRRLGERLVGNVERAELAEASAGVATLCHGDASLRNTLRSPAGELALVDWEDVRSAPGVTDLAWLLVSSVEPARWREVIEAYGNASQLRTVLPAAAAQGLLSLNGLAEDDPLAAGYVARLTAVERELTR